MNHNAPAPSSTTPALRRTWRTHHTTELDGAVISTSTHTVTLHRAAQGEAVNALIDGEDATLARAVALLGDAWAVDVLAEVLSAPTIGTAAACELHRELGRLQFRNHYSAASDALGRPVSSLAALNAAEAATVRSYAYGQWGLSA